MDTLQRSPKATSVAPPEHTPGELAFRSLLIPGLGQFAQGRRAPGLWQLGTVLTYLAIAVATGATQAAWLVVAWNLWSAIDAYVTERRSIRD